MNTTEPAAELQHKTPTEIYLVLNAGDHGEHLWSDKPVTDNGTQNAGPYVLRTAVGKGSATPRTDAAEFEVFDGQNVAAVVTSEFARELETELGMLAGCIVNAACKSPTEQIRELLAPYLAKVQSLADSRPDLEPAGCYFTCRIDSKLGLSFSAFFDYGPGATVGAHFRPTAEDAIAALTVNVHLIPTPPTREQLIAEARARLAALEGGQS